MNDGSKEVVLSDEFINTIWIFFKSKLSINGLLSYENESSFISIGIKVPPIFHCLKDIRQGKFLLSLNHYIF